MENLKIIYTGNNAMFHGIYISILSIIRRTKSNIDFYCLSGDLKLQGKKYTGITKEQTNILDKLVKSFNKNSSFNTIDCTKLYLNFSKSVDALDIQKWTPYTLFRLLIDKLNFNGKVLYLDVDILASGDIAEAFNVNMDGKELCVCHDRNHWWKKFNKWFCAGVMLMNLDVVRETNLLANAFNYCLKRKPFWWDQDALNRCSKKIMFWNDEYRFHNQPFANKKCKMNGEPILWHFYWNPKNIKPWLIESMKQYMEENNISIWKEDYSIFQKFLSNHDKK